LFPWKDQPIDAKQPVGRWKLESIARREPADFKVKEWTIESLTMAVGEPWGW
jgi:hypothetical protein